MDTRYACFILTVTIVFANSSTSATEDINIDPPDTEIETRMDLPDTAKAKFVFISFPDKSDTILGCSVTGTMIKRSNCLLSAERSER